MGKGRSESGAYPNVELAGEEALGDAQGVEHGAEDVEQAHEDEPAERGLAERVDPALGQRVVHGRHHARQAERQEQAGAQRSELGLAEARPQRHRDRQQPFVPDDKSQLAPSL